MITNLRHLNLQLTQHNSQNDSCLKDFAGEIFLSLQKQKDEETGNACDNLYIAPGLVTNIAKKINHYKF
jgi:hypothetical protein